MFPSYEDGGKIDLKKVDAFWRKHWPLAIKIAAFWDSVR